MKPFIAPVETFIHDDLKYNNQAVAEFLTKTLEGFGEEIEKIATNFLVNPNQIFAMIEQTYVGILSGTIQRIFPTNYILQELFIYENNKPFGRCDLIVQHQEDNFRRNIFIEAKQRQFSPKNFEIPYLENFLKSVAGQCNNYALRADQLNSLPNANIPMVFEWIRERKHISTSKNILKNWSLTNSFCSIYNSEDDGLLVYGLVS